VLPDETVYQKPSIEMLKRDIIMRNRSQLLHVRNIAHRNAILYSYLFQRLFDFEEPGLTYILLHNAGKFTLRQRRIFWRLFFSRCNWWSWNA
ncbi:unnamed protein product, partial [Rotaria magnacalcarata]